MRVLLSRDISNIAQPLIKIPVVPYEFQRSEVEIVDASKSVLVNLAHMHVEKAMTQRQVGNSSHGPDVSRTNSHDYKLKTLY